MTARQNFYAESLGESTTTSTSYSDKVALTATFDNGVDYWILATAKVNNSAGTSTDLRVQLNDDTVGSAVLEHIYRPKDQNSTTGDYETVFWLHKYTGAGASHTFSVEFRANTSGNTIRIRDAAIIAVAMDAADKFIHSAVEVDIADTSWHDGAQLTFTPATSGDYLLIAAAQLQGGTGGDTVDARLDHASTTQYGTAHRNIRNSGNRYSWSTAVKKTLAASSQVLTVQLSDSNPVDGVSLLDSTILAIRLDKFAANFYDESAGRSTTTSTTYQDKVTATHTPAAQDHLILGFGVLDMASSSDTGIAALNEAGSELVGTQFEAGTATGTDNQHTFMSFRKETLAASSTTWKTQYKTRVSATAGFSESGIAILELNQVAGGGGGGSLRYRAKLNGIGTGGVFPGNRLSAPLRMAA